MFTTVGITADLVDTNDRMSGSIGYTNTFRSPHGAIGEHVPKLPTPEPQIDISGLSLLPRDESRVSRDSVNFKNRGPFEPSSIWSKADTSNGWDRATASHFASRPQSPTKPSPAAPDAIGAIAPRTAPLPPYAVFNPVITPPAPVAVPVPLKVPSPARASHERELVGQAGHHLMQLQALMGPMVTRLDELEKLSADVAIWKRHYDLATTEVARLQALLVDQEAVLSTGVSFPIP